MAKRLNWLYWNCTTSPNEISDLLSGVSGAIALGGVDMAHESSVAKTGRFCRPTCAGERSATKRTPTQGRVSTQEACGSERVEPNGVSHDGEREWEHCLAVSEESGSHSSGRSTERLARVKGAAMSTLGNTAGTGGNWLGNSLHAGIKQGFGNVAMGAAMGQDIGKNGWNMFAGGFQTGALSHGAKELYLGYTGFSRIHPEGGGDYEKVGMDKTPGQVPYAFEYYNNFGGKKGGAGLLDFLIPENSPQSNFFNAIPGMNAIAGLHDTWDGMGTPFDSIPGIGSMLDVRGLPNTLFSAGAAAYTTYGTFESPF